MRTIKFSLIFVCLFIYFILGSLLRLILFWASPYVTLRAVNRLKFYLMHLFTIIGGIKVKIIGQKEILKKQGLFIISTHIGYLDGVILGTLVPGTFTTKEEIKKVPFIGKVVAIGGSIFVNRHKKGNIITYVSLMADCLRNKINVFNFPEGHATDGTKILSFFPAFFDAPLKTKSPIVPITIDYEKINGRPITNRDDVCCYDGRMSLQKHLWNLMSFKRIDVTIHIHDAIEINGHRSDSRGRKFMSDLCCERLSAYKNLPVTKDHPFHRPSRPVSVAALNPDSGKTI